MKRVPGLSAPPPMLAEFRDHHPGGTWKAKRESAHPAFQPQPGSEVVFLALAEAQGHLCAYCEIDIERGLKGQVEHFVPENLADETWNCALDHTNLLACCEGGTRMDIPNGRAVPPVPETQHCGQHKGAKDLRGQILDPREVATTPCIWCFGTDGSMTANEAACTAALVALSSANATIAELGLDRSGLRRMRAAVLKGLDDEVLAIAETDEDIPAAEAQVAREQLLPKDGRLPRFWSTIRHWAGEAAEEVLQANASLIPGMT